MKKINKLWYVLIFIALLSPFGLVIPDFFHGDTAWGEWDIAEISKMLGYVPEGMNKISTIWKAPLPDYNLPEQDSATLVNKSVIYIGSGLIGVCVFWLLNLIIECIVSSYTINKISVKQEKFKDISKK